jgi:hypothetical protein
MLPPRSDDDLLARSDLAGYARVLASNNCFATLKFHKFLKGRLKGRGIFARLGLSRTAVVKVDVGTRRAAYEGGPLIVVDSGNVHLFVPGNELKMYLWWDAQSEVYDSVWWNAVSLVRQG